jgi:hypothetical protein
MRRLFNEFVNRGDRPARESFQLMVGLVDCCVRGGWVSKGQAREMVAPFPLCPQSPACAALAPTARCPLNSSSPSRLVPGLGLVAKKLENFRGVVSIAQIARLGERTVTSICTCISYRGGSRGIHS